MSCHAVIDSHATNGSHAYLSLWVTELLVYHRTKEGGIDGSMDTCISALVFLAISFIGILLCEHLKITFCFA